VTILEMAVATIILSVGLFALAALDRLRDRRQQ
jgi:hypothetical protein